MAVRRPRSGGSASKSTLSVEVVGAERLAELAKRLRGADKAYRKALRIGINRAVKPLREAVKAQVPIVMPAGYAPVLKRSLTLRTQIRTGGLASVRVTAVAKGRSESRDIKALDKGVLRHPVYGRYRRTRRGRVPNPWVVQKITSGFWSETMRKQAPAVRREVLKAISDINDQIAKGP